jgi:hypothetical protein
VNTRGLAIDFFTSPTTFDGGFVLDPLLPKNPTEDHFCHSGIPQFSRFIRDIRNALSHGRDIRTVSVIAPTHRNFSLLEPWVILMNVAAGEVILYEDAL